MRKIFTRIINIIKTIKKKKTPFHSPKAYSNTNTKQITKRTQQETIEIPKIDQKKIKIIAFLIIGIMLFGTISGIFRSPSRKKKNHKNTSIVNNTIIPEDFEILSKDRKRINDKNSKKSEKEKYEQTFSQSEIIIPKEFSDPSRTALHATSQTTPHAYNTISWIRKYQQSQNTIKKESPPSIYVKGWENNNKIKNTTHSTKDILHTLLKNPSNKDTSITEALSLQNKTNYAKQNQQSEKKEFLENALIKSANTETIHIEKQESPFIISAGSIIPITIITSINSDLPGDIVGQVNRNVYDSVTGNFLLIPAGSKVIGNYDSNVAWGQRRVLVIWNRLLLPNGDSIHLGGMQGIDLLGHAGYNDKVDLHIGEIIGVTLASTILNIGQEQLSTFSNQQSNQYLQALTNALTSGSSNATSSINAIANKIINMQPTLKIRSGKRANIFVGKDIILQPYKQGF